MRGRLRVLLFAVLVVFGPALVAAGCGGDDDEDQVAEPLGGGEEGVDTLETFFDELQSFPNRQIELVAAFRSEDVPAARVAVDEQQALIDEGEESAADFESAELAEVIDDYLAGLGGAVAEADEFVAYFEGGAGGEAAKERSEERRVGKECRSRWSPCH